MENEVKKMESEVKKTKRSIKNILQSWNMSVIKTEAAAGGILSKKLFLEISQNSQENNCARVSFLIKLQAGPATLLK